MNIHFTAKSSNSKTGPMLTTIQSSDTCAPGCPFKGHGCYAEFSYLGILWKRVSKGALVKEWQAFLTAVKKQQKGSLWRMSVAGDLPHDNGDIDEGKLQEIVEANKHMSGFSYSHHEVLNNEHNRDAVKHANDNGFTINLSADNLKDADKKAALGIGPVAVPIAIDPENWPKTTPEGRPIVVCLNTTKDLTCVECGLCAVAKRKSVVGFPAHGTAKRKIEEIVTQ